jgi:hypothetical protein
MVSTVDPYGRNLGFLDRNEKMMNYKLSYNRPWRHIGL